MNAGEVITAARDLHTAFDTKRHPPATLYRFLTRYQQELAAKVVHVNEEEMAVSQSVSLPLTDFATGIVVNPHDYILGGEVSSVQPGGTTSPLTLLPWGNRFQQARWPAAYTLNGVVYLRGAASDWTTHGGLVLTYVPLAGTIDADADTLILPAGALAVLVNRLGQFMGSKGHKDPALPPIPIQKLTDDADSSENAFLDQVFNRRRGKSNKVRVVREYS